MPSAYVCIMPSAFNPSPRAPSRRGSGVDSRRVICVTAEGLIIKKCVSLFVVEYTSGVAKATELALRARALAGLSHDLVPCAQTLLYTLRRFASWRCGRVRVRVSVRVSFISQCWCFGHHVHRLCTKSSPS